MVIKSCLCTDYLRSSDNNCFTKLLSNSLNQSKTNSIMGNLHTVNDHFIRHFSAFLESRVSTIKSTELSV